MPYTLVHYHTGTEDYAYMYARVCSNSCMSSSHYPIKGKLSIEVEDFVFFVHDSNLCNFVHFFVKNEFAGVLRHGTSVNLWPKILCSNNRFILLQERVWDDVAVATSFRQADRSWTRRFAVASPRFIGRRSAPTVLSQDCLGRPILRLQLSGGPAMQAWRAWW